MSTAATNQVSRREFPDLADEELYPRLSPAQLEWLGKRGGERRELEAGDALYEHTVRAAPFYVLERGRVEIIDRKPGNDAHDAEADAGTCIGDNAAFTAEPTISACVAVEPTTTLAVERPQLREM